MSLPRGAVDGLRREVEQRVRIVKLVFAKPCQIGPQHQGEVAQLVSEMGHLGQPCGVVEQLFSRHVMALQLTKDRTELMRKTGQTCRTVKDVQVAFVFAEQCAPYHGAALLCEG